jgi:hypothetical protein
MRLATCVLVASIIPATVNHARAQSITAQLSGTIYDQQRGLVPDVAVTVVSLVTGQRSATVADTTGHFRVVGLVPGLYAVELRRDGFNTLHRTVTLTVDDHAEIAFTLGLAGVTHEVDVALSSRPEAIASRRLFTTTDIDNLPVAERDFTTLAMLAPGIHQNQVGTGSSTGITASGQTGRNNTYLVDGMTLDDTQLGSARGGLSLDTVREFVVLSNGFSAEYGQASGAVISVATRSGANQRFGRVFYDHRDDAWDATPHEAHLATPPLESAPYEQKIGGGFLGGPIVRDREFYFTSIEQTMLDTEAIITSPLLHTFRPAADAHVPSRDRITQAFARADVAAGSFGSLSPRTRVQRTSVANLFVPADVGIAAPERANDFVVLNTDAALVHNRVWRATRMNEFRGQFARRNLDRVSHCPDCPAEDHPSFKLGKYTSVPNGSTEERWQFADALTTNVSNRLGEQTFKAGADVSLIQVSSRGLQDKDGTFTFSGDAPFDPLVEATYPTRYTQTFGEPALRIDHRVYAAFVQDRWKVGAATVDIGVRGDYDNAPGASGDTNDIAPRLAAAFDPWRTGRTVFHGGYGRYYDQIPLSIAIAALQGQSSLQIFVQNPDYQSHANPMGHRELKPNTSRLLDMSVPRTDQFMAGVTHVWSPAFVVSADVVKARGRHLLLTRDLNYPQFDLPLSPRPNPHYQKIVAVDSTGHSWYRAVQIGVESLTARKLSWSAAYTWSLTERDTEDYTFSPQDQMKPEAERGPAANDTRHQFVATAQSALPWGLRLSPVVALHSAVPYTITLGRDANHDLVNNDRPPGVSRNSARGGGFIQADVLLAKAYRRGNRTIQGIVEVFNVANRANWTGVDGRQSAPTPGVPTAAGPSRQIQVGLRVDF